MHARSSVLAFGVLLATPSPAVAGNVTYAPGALIIPTQASFQDSCGAVSAFGLVYQTLRANDWLEANGFNRITIHYGFKSAKGSPNRCIPTNLSTPPAPSTDVSWDDGCDFKIVDAAATPVKLVVNATATSSATDTNVVTFDTTGNANVFPGYAAQTIMNTGIAASSVTTVGYMGGPFIISATDAVTFTKLLEGTLIAKDINLNNIDFTTFRSNSGSCTFGTTHYVRIHRVQKAFTVELNRQFTQTPPRISLLATGTSVTNNILQKYLTNAGLNFTGAQGCPPGGTNIGSSTLCPNGGTPGQIFDTFDVQDYADNLHFLDDSNGRPLYRTLWTPHWDVGTTPSATETSALGNISNFLETQRGLFGECASIGSFEGSKDGGGSFATNVDSTASSQFQTCKDNGSGACSVTAVPRGFLTNPTTSPATSTLQNCTNPTTATGAACAYFADPADPFVQIADYVWKNDPNSVVKDFLPNGSASMIYEPGVLPLISNIATLDKTKLATKALARTIVVGDVMTRSVKDNTAGKGNISYLGGHDLGGTVAGTMIVMETLLQLDLVTSVGPAVITEVSRNSPITATVGNQAALVQGTYENVSPSPLRSEINVNSDASFFTFPHLKGHMRAIATSDITTSGKTFNDPSITPIFDAANGIPTPTFGGCGASHYKGTATCRTIFTTTAANCGTPTNPTACTATVLDTSTSTVAIVGPLLASNITTVNQTTLIKRILAGISDGNGGFVAKLGGVDRSTVAVIPESSVAGTSRPTVAYFGATDGMLHAVCASEGLGCTVGRELWAYLPRTNLAKIRYNTARVDGSPHVIDAFGDFNNDGKREFKTILTFQTGSGSASTAGVTPAVYALDITDPLNPTVVWENTIANVATRGAHELGQGLTLTAGKVLVSSQLKNVVFAQTNNGGTAGAGSVVSAINLEDGSAIWTLPFGRVDGTTGAYPNPPRAQGSAAAVPTSAIPGGAVGIDKAGNGLITDLVFGDIYGSLWLVDPATGASRVGTNLPVFSFTTNYHSIGVRPAILAKGNVQYAVFVSGGYADQTGTTWGTGVQQFAVAVSLNSTTQLDETSASPGIGFKFDLGANEKGFAQAVVVGNEIFFTTDTGDVNSSSYGTTGSPTGKLYRLDFDGAEVGTSVVLLPPDLAGGANMIANSGTALFTASATQTQKLATDASGTTGTAVDAIQLPKVARKLWVRTQ